MWILTLNDNSVGELVDVVASTLEEVRDIVDYVMNSSGILELEHVEQRELVFGLKGFKEMSETL